MPNRIIIDALWACALAAALPAAPTDIRSSGGSTGADDCHEAIVNPLPAGPPGKPNAIVLEGVTSPAISRLECNGNLGPAWWEAFDLDRCATVTIDFCEQTANEADFNDVLAADCAPDGSSCSPLIETDTADRACDNGNPRLIFRQLRPGTYYFPIIPGTSGSPDELDPYRLTITAETCAGTCERCVGACCNPLERRCVDGLFPDECTGPNEQWFLQKRCAAIECRPFDEPFDVAGMTLLAHVPADVMTEVEGGINEMWGYVSPTGREYAIVGLALGTAFIDITNPLAPALVDVIPDAGSLWSDMAVFGHYVYNVNESAGGMQIIDVSRIDNGIVELTGALQQNAFETAHNLFVNADSAHAYLCGANAPTAGLVAVDLADPANPTMVGIWTDNYAHDVYVTSYADCPYAGRTGPCEIAFVFGAGNGLQIVDVTDKTDMTTIADLDYDNLAICHEGWLTEDKRYLLMGDEADESFFGLTTTTYVVDMQDLANPFVATTFTTGLASIDHNLMIRGDLAYEANYSSGLRVFDISDVLNAREVAYFDTHPGDNARSFDGAWGVFTQYPSGVVTVSDRSQGLFVLWPCFDSSINGNDRTGNDTAGATDLAGFARLQRCFGPGPKAIECQPADTDCNGTVNLADLNALLSE